MDPAKPSLPSKVPDANNGKGNEVPMEEAAEHWRDGGESERWKETETKEVEVDGLTTAAETIVQHRGSADKHKFSTLGYQRRTVQKVVTDFATVSKGTSTGVKPRTALRQVLFSQGVSDKNSIPEDRGQSDALKQVLEAFPVPASLTWKWEEENRGTTLEKNWTDIVYSHSTMVKMQRHQQEALWEFVHTELAYINKLTIIRDLVIAALVNLHQHGFLLEVTPELLFFNLPSVLSAHCLFWQEVMYPMLEEARRTGKPFDPLRLEAGCLQFDKRFSSYLQYCWEEENTLEFTRRQTEANPHFLIYLQWVESHPQCERMRLGDMQAKPHQRITKYPLLLKAVLSTTQDPYTQHRLRGMLSSVNAFLDSINDYLRFKDEELALSISAQRVEGYEVEGINEEIDKHVREICRFDLTCPIRGVGPGVVRKLLLEENLRTRGRKDSKLDVVALLFSDVLLLTKVQKKAERLKVVRPPLALDRTCCVALRDGCSFVLVEATELGCAANVYVFTTATSESCSTWISTIHLAKETLKGLRETETNKQLENQRLQQSEAKIAMEAEIADVQTNNPPLEQSEETFVDELTEKPVIPKSENGTMESKVTETNYQPSNQVDTNGSGLPRQLHNFSKTCSKSEHGHFYIPRPRAVQGRECIEMNVRGEQAEVQREDEESAVKFRGTMERRVTWNSNRQAPSDSGENILTRNMADPLRYKLDRSQLLLVDGYPDVDYPSTEPSTFVSTYGEHLPTDSMGSSEFQFQGFPRAWESSTRRDLDTQSVNQETGRHSRYCPSEEEDTLSEVWRFSRKLKSPRLRRRRPVSSHQSASTVMYKPGFKGSGVAWSAPYTNSSSNSDSDCNQRVKRNFPSFEKDLDSHQMLKLMSVKHKQAMFRSMSDERVSPDPQTYSEPELPKEAPSQNLHNIRRPKLKTQRSASTPDIIIQGAHRLHMSATSTLPGIEVTPPPSRGHHLQRNVSPLDGLLERAKVRLRDQEVKREKNGKMRQVRTLNPPPSPSLSTTPSPSPSDGDRETEWAEVELMRCRAPTVSMGWKEQLVDGDEEEKKHSAVFTDGVNVDWPGWCFDDEEVMDQLTPDVCSVDDEGLLEGIRRTLTSCDFKLNAEQDDGECSQV
ncbi:uncharacterized protein plekhg6 [Lampris incognitus]|uniref:uncharacterized protein plekhg6 n=1 Tax=Lampris incognitus TaxID=2546036 RepID=UPI0024B4992E|nr:uncharacterized protein plekhg6 [Lampris incognitus]